MSEGKKNIIASLLQEYDIHTAEDTQDALKDLLGGTIQAMHAPSEEICHELMEKVTAKWQEHYPNAMKSWKTNWDAICPIFKFSADVRKVIYTTISSMLKTFFYDGALDMQFISYYIVIKT